MEAIIFTQTGCPTCESVKAFLTARGVAWQERDVSHDAAAFDELHARGYRATPLTVIGEAEILGLDRRKFALAGVA
ncbi:MAG: glutaredoxin family protein [Candidatus Xenobia bacterium]